MYDYWDNGSRHKPGDHREEPYPFCREKIPNRFRIYQDNDSKHVSKSTKEWMHQKNILDKMMKTLASLKDINPIENVCAAIKLHLTYGG